MLPPRFGPPPGFPPGLPPSFDTSQPPPGMRFPPPNILPNVEGQGDVEMEIEDQDQSRKPQSPRPRGGAGQDDRGDRNRNNNRNSRWGNKGPENDRGVSSYIFISFLVGKKQWFKLVVN